MKTLADTTKTPPFRKGGDNVLLAALNERQRRRESADGEPVATGGPWAISSAEVREVLEEIGMAGGFDRTATHLFFGEDGRSGYIEFGDEIAIQTHGGFVFNDSEEGDTYIITATRLIQDFSLKSPPRWPMRTDNDGLFTELVDKLLGRRLYSPACDGEREGRRERRQSELTWRVSARAMCYEVQPRFYEDIGFLDLIPFADDVDDPADAGIISLYPLQKSERISIHTGAITASGADTALQLADSLGAVMAENGVLCDPRVVLLESGDMPLLPRHARNERLWASRESTADAADNGDSLLDAQFLGAPRGLGIEDERGHRVRQRRGRLVPDQQKAAYLARRASEYSAYQDRVLDLQKRLDDPHIPERRKERIRTDLARDAAVRDEVQQALEDETQGLAGLVLSLIDERRELAANARLREMGL